jgi:NifU-like protein involved in Fe-S cluster formation
MQYSAEVRRRFAAARPAAQPPGDLSGIVRGEAEDRALNVWVRFQIEARAGKARAVSFEVFGCPHTVAAASWLAEHLRGESLELLTQWNAHELARALEMPIEKLGKLFVLQDALGACRSALSGKDIGKDIGKDD